MRRGVKRTLMENTMQKTFTAAVLGLGLIVATPIAAQTPNVGQMLQGLMTGNQGQDQALRDAFERGYQRGRQDEARQQRPDPDRGRRNGDDRRSDDDRGGYREDNPANRSYGRPGGTTYGR